VASGRGRLSSFVVVRRPIDGIPRELPYVVAVVRLDEGVDLMTNLVGCDLGTSAPRVGHAVSVVFHALAGGITIPCFRLDPEP
jgi:uncharacterized OB-fold protein